MFSLIPYGQYNRNVNQIERMFDQMFSDFPQFSGLERFDLKVDIKEDEKSYTIYADLPGVKKDDVKLEIKDDVLTLEVRRDEKYDKEKDNIIRKERRYGKFKRSFYIDDVDKENIKAKLDEGILKIRLLKKRKEKNTINIEID